MYCRNCGKENKAGAAFCLHCGTRMEALGATAESSMPGPVAAEPKKKKKVSKKKLWTIIITVGLVAALALVGLFFYNRRDRYNALGAYTWWYNEDGGYTMTYKGKTIYEAEEYPGLQTTMDGRTAMFMDDDDIYLARGKKVKRIIKNVDGGTMASSGNAIAYRKEGRLYWYNCLTKQSKKIAKDVADYSISYNGKYVAFSTSEALYIWDGKDKIRVGYAEEGSTLQCTIWSVSDQGLVYVVTGAEWGVPDLGTLYSFTKDGDMTKIKENVEQYGWYELNRSRDQLIFYAGDPDESTAEGFYVSVNGGKAKKLDLPGTSNVLDMAGAGTYSVKNLYGQIYCHGGDTLFRLNKDWEVEMILEDDCAGCSRAYDNSALYAKDEDGTLYKINLRTGAKKEVAEDVFRFAAAGLGMVYFTDEDDTLYRNSDKHEVEDFVEQFIGKDGGGVLYVDEDGDLYSADILGKGREIDDDVWRVARSGSSFAYYKENEDYSDRADVYFSKGGNTFKKLRDVYSYYYG